MTGGFAKKVGADDDLEAANKNFLAESITATVNQEKLIRSVENILSSQEFSVVIKGERDVKGSQVGKML